MPLLRPAPSDITSYKRLAAQYVAAGGGGKPSASGRGAPSILALGAAVRTSLVGVTISPKSTTLVIPYLNTAVVASAPAAVVFSLAYAGTGNDAFIAKYNAAGVVQWVARQAGTGSDTAYGVTADSSGNVIVAGYYGSALTIYNADGQQFGTTLALTGGSYDAFIAKYNAAGVVQWVAQQVGTGPDIALAVTVDSSGNVIVAGSYGSALTIYNA